MADTFNDCSTIFSLTDLSNQFMPIYILTSKAYRRWSQIYIATNETVGIMIAMPMIDKNPGAKFGTQDLKF